MLAFGVRPILAEKGFYLQMPPTTRRLYARLISVLTKANISNKGKARVNEDDGLFSRMVGLFGFSY